MAADDKVVIGLTHDAGSVLISYLLGVETGEGRRGRGCSGHVRVRRWRRSHVQLLRV